jgi:porin
MKIVSLSGFTGKKFATAALMLAAAPASAQQAPPVASQFEPQVTQPAGPVTLSLSYASDLNADVEGGQRRGAAYLGKASLAADADLDRLIGLPHATGHISILDIHGVGLSGHYVGNLAPVSGIEAEPAIRLNQAWLQIPVGRAQNLTLRLGKFPAAQVFMVSPTASLFISSTFGWPGSFANDLPSGGPSWPLSAPGAMAIARIGGHATARVAVFAGDPAGPGQGDPQHRDRHGFNSFGFAGRPFLIAETAYAAGGATVTIGGWVHFNRFADIRTPFSPAVTPPRQHPRNLAGYAMIDGAIWKSDSAGSPTLSAFGRLSASPSDRNPVDIYFDGGITLKAPFAGRPRDVLGFAVARSRISPRLREAAWLAQRSGLPSASLPGSETVVEASYSFAANSQLSLQPNAQFVRHPSANALSPAVAAGRTGNAMIVGLRTTFSLTR